MTLYRLRGFLVCILILFIFHPVNTTAQDRISEDQTEFIRHFQQLQEFLPRERIHLHTDRQWYFEGDRIWFSVYVTAGPHNVLSKLSKVIYVDLYNPAGIRVERHIAELENGRAAGSILLDTHEEFEGGNFEIIAYTGWMLNFHESYQFSKTLPVKSFGGTYATADPPAADSLDIRFFPESGHLVDGLRSRVGFKAVGTDGQSAEISGVIFDDLDNQITAFVEGYHPATQFYAPRYGITLPRDSEQVDHRITLYWNPKVNTTDAGVTAQFWTNDMPGEYRIVIEGITGSGQLFHKTALITNQEQE